MRSLVISRQVPYPPTSGAPLRTWQNIRVLATRGPVSVLSFGPAVDGVDELPGVEDWEHVKDEEYPSGPAGTLARVRRLLRPMQFPLPNERVTSELNDRLRRCIARTAPDVVVLSNWMHAFPEALRDMPSVVVDAHNIEAPLYEEMQRAKALPSLPMRLQFARYRRRERRLLRSAARVWVSSQEDAAAMARLDPSLAKPVLWPNVIDVDTYADVRTDVTALPSELEPGRPTIIYIGYYAYPPNGRAALRLIERILPRVAVHVPGVRLLLVGRDPTSEMSAAAADDRRIVITGRVVDTRPYLRAATVCAVPLAEGGGTRLKIIEAFAAGVPVVSTTKGAEGLDVESGRHLLLADDDAAIADAVVEVLQRPAAYRQQADAALRLTEERYSLATLTHALDDALPARAGAAASVVHVRPFAANGSQR